MDSIDIEFGDWVILTDPRTPIEVEHVSQALMVVDIRDSGEVVVSCEDEHCFIVHPSQLDHGD